MRYKSIELINYAGIYNGMNLYQIKIDFTKCISNKIIIRGANGSGKSTIINAINPNPDSNDNFIAGAEARKNIELVDNGIEYIIRYIHPVNNNGTRGTTRGYISKTINGQQVELNPNGNISSCKEIIYDEFGFDSAYASLSQLSSEDRGLVDKKPIERKKLINTLTNSLDTFNAIYKSVSKKSALLKGMINSLTNKIDMIGDEAKVTVQLQSIEQQIAQLEQDKNAAIEAMATVKVKISDLQEYLEQNKYDEINTELATVNRMVKSTGENLDKSMKAIGVDTIDSLREFYTFVIQSISALQANLDSLRAMIPGIISQREVEYKSLQEKKEKLNSLQSDHSYTDVKAAYEICRSKLDNFESIFNEIGLRNIALITKEEYNTAMRAIYNLKSMAGVLLANNDIKTIEEDIRNRSNVLSIIGQIPKMRSDLDSYQAQLSELSIRYNVFQAKREVAKELINRPAKCSIDDCPYIASAFKANLEYPEEEFIALGQKIEELENIISNLRASINSAEEAAVVRNQVSNIERELSNNAVFIMKLPVRRDFIESFLDRVLDFDPFYDIDKLYSYIDCGNMIEEYKSTKDQFSIYETEYKVYQSKNTIIDSILQDINNLNNRVDELASQMDDIAVKIHDAETKLEDLKNTKEKVESMLDKYDTVYKPYANRQQELLNIKQSLDANVAQIQALRAQLNQVNMNIGGISSDIKNLSDRREALNHSLVMLAEYRIELAKYSKEYALIEKVKYYSSPNTGISSVFIGIYMNKILSTANELLGMLFGGEFTLQPFIVNESEFRIPFIGNGIGHDDISSMSTAQRSVISMIISFALLHQSSSKYNIVTLDELDGGLDTINRNSFVNLLDNLMGLLRCEQAFIISHNNELDTSMCDMIVLKKAGEDGYNGNIIWSY